MRRQGIWQRLGPAILFAGAAVGVSHLVQSTRAGALYGLGMALPVLVVLILKFPAFAVGNVYTARTKRSLLSAYSRLGAPYLVLFGVLCFVPFFIVTAAITVVTSGLGMALIPSLSSDTSVLSVSAALLAAVCCLLVVGGYSFLDRLMKVMFVLMTVATLLATALALPKVSWGASLFFPQDLWTKESFVFLMALLGFMPAPLDVSVLQSYWVLQKQKTQEFDEFTAWVDFWLSYIVTGLLALCFMIMGAALFWQSGQELMPKAVDFSKQLLDLYTAQLGAWTRPLVGLCAFGVMLSTTLAIVDGFPRVMVGWWEELMDFKKLSIDSRVQAKENPLAYLVALLLLAGGSWLILYFALKDLKQMVDVATTLTALVSPFLAFLNHQVFFASNGELKMAKSLPGMAALSWVGIFALSILSIAYLTLV